MLLARTSGLLKAFAAAVPVLVAVTAVGCGQSGGEGGTDRGPAATGVLSLPSASRCGVRYLRSTASPERLVPRAGIYRYRTRGSLRVAGVSRSVERLPEVSRLEVTRAAVRRGVMCVRTRMTLATGLGQVSTLAARNHDVYATVLGFQAAGHTSSLSPQPPMRTFTTGGATGWSASFVGRSRGQYAADVVGRKTIRIGSRRVRTIGVRLRLSIAGEVEGSEVSTRWIVAGRNLVAQETVVRQQRIDKDLLTLRYSARLMSLTPR